MKEKNLRINLMKNLLTWWETEEKNRKISGNMPLIDRKHSSKVLLIDRKCSENVLLINKELAELENNAECAFFPKFTKLVKKPSNLIKTGKKKPHRPISHSLTCFVKPVRRSRFCFTEDLMGWTNGLAMGEVELRRGKVAIGFSGWSLYNVEIIFRRYMIVEDDFQVLSFFK